MKIQVRSLNSQGVALFTQWLEDPIGEAPFLILESADCTDDISGQYYIDASLNFETSFELGKYLHEQVFLNVKDPVSLERQDGLWAWLSLAFINSLLSRSKKIPLDSPHYVELADNHGRRLAYRLITRTAWRLYRLHGELSIVAMGSKRSPWGEMAEQMTARQEIFSHRSFWQVAHKLYLGSKGEVRRGATSQRSAKARKDPKNMSGKGGVRRLPTTFRQFDRTYLTRIMSLDQMLKVLPNEYLRWKY